MNGVLFGKECFRWYTVRPIENPDEAQKALYLLVAVLQRALQDYLPDSGVSTSESSALREWMFSDAEEELTSFYSICQLLGVDAEMLREHLGKMSSEGLRRLRRTGFSDVQ